MKTLIWKIRYAIYFKRKLAVDWKLSWQDAGAMIESYPDCLSESPVAVAEDSIDAWWCSQ